MKAVKLYRSKFDLNKRPDRERGQGKDGNRRKEAKEEEDRRNVWGTSFGRTWDKGWSGTMSFT